MNNIISASELKQRLEKKQGIVLDVRSGAEYESVHIPDSYNLPLEELENYVPKLSSYKKEIYVLCKTGRRAGIACNAIDTLKNKHVFLIEGGITSWLQHDFNVVRGVQKWELERQVRLAAGTLVVLGFLLGFFAHSYWHLLSAFVGLGLAFAALTNTCAMGMLFAKLPYNKGSDYRKKLNTLFKKE